ncbi:MAG TPA: ribosome recycling factor [Planctomycetota bacterium]|jgi:ribosome recycling factor|nr:ribosome recycling factor [Planctomycetota bacterium]MDP6129857.1 ribosome recycling factor [Planctomycetota bacterium]MDP7246128.1 ribosome recycling factor [Planctomycetota bacterium]MDP7559578.1 ribosome recycling factor [Planctomycetota bacterium]HJM39315.1 ribosome recycling factor [Planctomycetota bacterium]|tara:strand:- start:39591 stop:40169 length:579 start_codon:yes stop_codon:yes gene_type:complete
MSSSIQPFLRSAKERLSKSVEHFSSETRGIRTGRATTGLVDNIRVDYYGSKTPLNQLASVAVPDPRSILVKPFDASSLKDIEKAILSSDLGMNPSIEGNALRISIPPLSAEQRQKLAGRIKSLAEETRISMRNVRRDCIKEVESASKDKKREDAVSEDDVRQAKDEVQSLLKEHEGQIEDLLASKTKEILDL